jgi:hypothetical protein
MLSLSAAALKLPSRAAQQKASRNRVFRVCSPESRRHEPSGNDPGGLAIAVPAVLEPRYLECEVKGIYSSAKGMAFKMLAKIL